MDEAGLVPEQIEMFRLPSGELVLNQETDSIVLSNVDIRWSQHLLVGVLIFNVAKEQTSVMDPGQTDKESYSTNFSSPPDYQALRATPQPQPGER